MRGRNENRREKFSGEQRSENEAEKQEKRCSWFDLIRSLMF